MAPPNTHGFKEAIVEILSTARDEGRLSQLTVRIVRRELATRFGVEEDVLGGGEYKTFIKETVHVTVDGLQNVSDGEGGSTRRKIVEKEKSDGKAKTSRKRSSKPQVNSSDEEAAEDANGSEADVPPSKTASARSKPSKATKSGRTSKKPETEMKYKSKAILESSDEEAKPESRTRKAARSPKKEQTSKKASLPKQKQRETAGSGSDVEMNTGKGPGPSSSNSKPSVSRAKELPRDPMESELSSVIDEPPKKRQMKRDREAKPPKDERITLGKKKGPSSKGEERLEQKTVKDDSNIETNAGEGPGPSMPKPATQSPKPLMSKAKELPGDLVESELSSVIDEPPKKRQKKQDKEPAKLQENKKVKRGKKKEALSKDEETVDKLKGIVVACGVRKVWKKEFDGLDKPSQQIKRLHSILGELGMTPRYSLDKARTIRERKELAQELEDVQAFEKAMQRRGKRLRSSSETEDSADEGDSSADVPASKRQNARASIMAFLQDQSEEE